MLILRTLCILIVGIVQLDLVLNSEDGGDLSDFITNGEWYLIGGIYIFFKLLILMCRSEKSESCFRKICIRVYFYRNRSRICRFDSGKTSSGVRVLALVLQCHYPRLNWTELAGSYNFFITLLYMYMGVCVKILAFVGERNKSPWGGESCTSLPVLNIILATSQETPLCLLPWEYRFTQTHPHIQRGKWIKKKWIKRWVGVKGYIVCLLSERFNLTV